MVTVPAAPAKTASSSAVVDAGHVVLAPVQFTEVVSQLLLTPVAPPVVEPFQL